jgi:hypothetical protein
VKILCVPAKPATAYLDALIKAATDENPAFHQYWQIAAIDLKDVAEDLRYVRDRYIVGLEGG